MVKGGEELLVELGDTHMYRMSGFIRIVTDACHRNVVT